MKPTSLLTDRDYERLLDELLKSPSPSDFLNACEADYLPVNQSFYGLLLNAIRREIGKRMSELNAFLCLPANKGFDYEEARQIFIDPKLEETKVLVEGRAQAFAKKNDWRPAFKERLLAFLLSETERKLKKDSDMFSKEIPLEKEVGAVARKAYLDAEMQRINSDSAYKAFRILRAETGDLEDFLLLEIHKRISFIREEPGHIYNAANQIEVGKNYTVYLEGLKTENRLRILQGAIQEMGKTVQGEPEFFYTVEGMEKAFRAAHLAGLTHPDDTWRYTGNKIDGVTIFWRAAIAAGLAKADAPGYKVAPFLKDRFRLDSLGKNAIEKKRKIDSYDLDLQKIYNTLVHSMGK